MNYIFEYKIKIGGKSFMKNNRKGISLIVLVITIIVIIILAGTIILSLTNNNVIAKANLAKESNDFTQLREMVEMEKSNMLLSGTTTYIPGNTPVPTSYSSEIEITTGGTILIKGTSTSKIADIPNAIEKLGAVYVPAGFVASGATGENSKENGLVIYEGTTEVNDGNVASQQTTRNQFVWIPVDGALERKAFLGENLADIAEYNVDSISEKNLYDSMKASVEKYNGFYIGRYEVSNVNSQKNKEVSLGNTFGYEWGEMGIVLPGNDEIDGAAKWARAAYQNSESVVSSLPFGCQYDSMLKFIDSTSTNLTNSKDWGNYSNSTFTVNTGARYKLGTLDDSSRVIGEYIDLAPGTSKPANELWLMTTGASEQNKTKNIYDVGGNVSENTYDIWRGLSCS
jgi:Tfp pilus assembly protein PilE